MRKEESIYVLESQDIECLKAILNYAYHRTTRHKKTIASYTDIQRLRKEFGIIDEETLKKQENMRRQQNTVIYSRQ